MIGPDYGPALNTKERKLAFILHNELTHSHILTHVCVCIICMCVYILIHHMYYEKHLKIVVKSSKLTFNNFKCLDN